MSPRISFILTAALFPSAANAQDAKAPALSADAAQPVLGEDEEAEAPIVITGGRPRGSVVGDIPPQNVLDSRDVRATGATSITELLDALAPQIGSAQGRGGEAPVLLLNGRRISGFRELRDIPTEAIERVEILPEEVALKYGFAATQKVVNIVLRERFRSTAVLAGVKRATDGGYASGQVDATRLMINRAGRTTVNLHAEGNGRLTEAERDVDLADDSQAARTLLGSKRSLRGTASVNRVILGDVSATLNGELSHDEGRSLLGTGSTGLDVLGRDTKNDGLHGGLTLDGDKAKWHWNVIGNLDLDWSATGTDRDDPQFARDRARTSTIAGDLSATANGAVFKLPAGDASATVRAGASMIDLDGVRRSAGVRDETSLARRQGQASINLDLPVSRRKRDFSALGDLSVNLNAEVRRLSDFGTLLRYGSGAFWSPVERLNLLASLSSEDGAPTIQQLGDPALVTPDTRLFDFVTGQTVFATVTSGGNQALNADRRRVLKLGANWQPFKDQDLRLRGEFVRSVIDRPIESLVGPTPALEAAFPDRFVRDADGRLISADLRPMNFDQARRTSLRLGLDFSKKLRSARPPQTVLDQLRAQFRRDRPGGSKSPPSPPDGAPPPDEPSPGGVGGGRGVGGGGSGFFGGRGGRLSFSLTDTIILVDKVSIGAGLPEIDYLHGDAAGNGGGTPRHKLEAQAGWANNGLGARLSANWRSGTRVDSLTAGELRFSPLATFDLRLFANFGERAKLTLKHPWLRGSTLRLEVTNLFNAKQKVRDGTGAVPINYQPDLIDPLGRTVMVTFRKLFRPSFAAMRRDFEREAR